MDAALVPADPQNHANPLIATTTTTRRAVTVAHDTNQPRASWHAYVILQARQNLPATCVNYLLQYEPRVRHRDYCALNRASTRARARARIPRTCHGRDRARSARARARRRARPSCPVCWYAWPIPARETAQSSGWAVSGVHERSRQHTSLAH